MTTSHHPDDVAPTGDTLRKNAVLQLVDTAVCQARNLKLYWADERTIRARKIVEETASAISALIHVTAPLASAGEAVAWSTIPSGKRFGLRLTAEAVGHLEPGTLLRFHSPDPWFDHSEGMPGYGEIVAFTGVINNDFPKVGPHLEVATLADDVYPGGGWVFGLFQFVSDPLAAKVSPVLEGLDLGVSRSQPGCRVTEGESLRDHDQQHSDGGAG